MEPLRQQLKQAAEVLSLLHKLPSMASQKNAQGQTPLDLMPATLRMAVKPQLYSALAAAASNRQAVPEALKKSQADPVICDSRGFSPSTLTKLSLERHGN